MSKFTEKTISTREIFDGQILKLRVDEIELPDGRKSTREIIEHAGGVAIVPVTDQGKIILVKQFRKAVDAPILEIPAGKLEPGEKSEECARRELIEETGFAAGNLKKICSVYTSPGYSDEVLQLFLGKQLQYKGNNLDSDEFIEIKKLKSAEIIELIKQEEIKDSKTIIGILSYLRGDF